MAATMTCSRGCTAGSRSAKADGADQQRPGDEGEGDWGGLGPRRGQAPAAPLDRASATPRGSGRSPRVRQPWIREVCVSRGGPWDLMDTPPALHGHQGESRRRGRHAVLPPHAGAEQEPGAPRRQRSARTSDSRWRRPRGRSVSSGRLRRWRRRRSRSGPHTTPARNKTRRSDTPHWPRPG
jgi:hypothetical protein